jgi:hypothetical protein
VHVLLIMLGVRRWLEIMYEKMGLFAVIVSLLDFNSSAFCER